ncbi:MAG: hypothetical protein AB7J86_20800 [Vulcanimicrobiota bacterium]
MNFQLGLGVPQAGYSGYSCGGGQNPLTGLFQLILGLMMGLLGGDVCSNLLGGDSRGHCFSPNNPSFGTGFNPGRSFGAPLGGFLGAPNGGDTFSAGNAPSVDLGSIQGGTPWGRSLASDAARNANGPGGWCYKWVANALGRHGVNVHGASAYMAADQLAGNPKFREVRVPANQLRNLPPGAVVVWNRGAGHPHGHISIALGDGREASDKIRNQITNYGTSFRVFLPNQ